MSFKSIIAVCAVAFLQSIAAQAIGPCNAAAAYAEGAFLAGPYAGAYDGFYGAYETGYGPAAFAGPYAGLATPFAGSYAAPFSAPFAGEFGYAAWPYTTASFASAPYADPAALAASNGGGLTVTSASPIAPSGISMVSENAYEGPLAVTGFIPFLGAVALDGALSTAGAGAVTYGCGNGNVAMMSEDFAGPGYNAWAASFGYNGYANGDYGYDYGYGNGYGYGMPGPYGYGPFGNGCAF